MSPIEVLASLWRREPTIGDHIADSLLAEPEEWQSEMLPGFGLGFSWSYTNKGRGWRLLVTTSFHFRSISFNQCDLTGREERRIWRALRHNSRDAAKRRREAAHRRLAIRAVN